MVRRWLVWEIQIGKSENNTGVGVSDLFVKDQATIIG